MKKILLAVAIVSFSLVSCVKNSNEYKDLRQENDSLLLINAQTQAEFDSMLTTLNSVEDGFAQIKEAENYLTVQSNTAGEMNANTRQRLEADMHLVAETLKNNREQIAKLEKQLKGSQYQSSEMKKTLARLTAELETKTAMITTLQEELAKRDIRIQELDDAVSELSGRVNNLTQETVKQDETLKSQDKEINSVWYVYGTKEELKKQKIVSGGGLFKATEVLKGDFNKDYFIKDDLRKLKEIPLYAKKAKLLSNQPAGSYELKKDESGNITLMITNPQDFWSLSKYLVIQVD